MPVDHADDAAVSVVDADDADALSVDHADDAASCQLIMQMTLLVAS